jgi:hypothetical protein
MGLDISAYQNLEFVKGRDSATDDDWDNYISIYVNPDFPGRAGSLHSGFYNGQCVHSFRAGSYGGYNVWRERLSRLVLDVLPNAIWTNFKAFAGKPFVELIHFSDCEGAIGPGVSAKLAGDFAAWEGEARDAWGEDSYDFQKYMDWQRAFDLASLGGAVEFH